MDKFVALLKIGRLATFFYWEIFLSISELASDNFIGDWTFEENLSFSPDSMEVLFEFHLIDSRCCTTINSLNYLLENMINSKINFI